MQNITTISNTSQKMQQSLSKQLNKNSTLCINKEFFYLITLITKQKNQKENKITKEEYIEATKIITNLDSIYDMNKYEKNLYQKSINTIENYLLYTK